MKAVVPRNRKSRLVQIFPEVLYPGNMSAYLEACYVLGTLPKDAAGKPGPFIQEKRLILKRGKLFCNIVLHFEYDPLQLGEGWESRPHVWLLRQAQQQAKRWHFLIQAQPGMSSSECNAEWPRLIEGGTHILWQPIRQANPAMLQVRQNGTIVPHDPP